MTEKSKNILKISVWIFALWGMAVIICGPYAYNAGQKSFWFAVIELAIINGILFWIMNTAVDVKRKLCYLCLCVLLFTYIHSFLWAFCVGILYFILIYMTGNMFNRYIIGTKETNCVADILMGIIGVIVLIAVCSLFGIGMPAKLRLVLIVLFLAESIVFITGIRTHTIIPRKLFSTISAKADSGNSLLAASIVTAFLLQVGRANICLDYDSVWYGLRSSSMLAPYGGIYDKVISSSCVYVYSKGVETLSLPFNFETSYSFVYAVNLMLAAVCLYMMYKISNLFASTKLSLFIVLCAAITPGIMNMAVTAKSDIATLSLELMLIYFVLKFLKEKQCIDMIYAISACGFSYAFKATSLVFSTFIALISFIYILKNRHGILGFQKKQLLTIFFSTAGTCLILYRTFMITGYPITSLVTGVLTKIGFQPKYPFGHLAIDQFVQTSQNAFSVKKIFEFFLYPITEYTDHVIIAWPSMMFFCALLVVFCYIFFRIYKLLKQKQIIDDCESFILVVMVTLFILTLYSITAVQKPDGNYFMIFYAVVYLCFLFVIKTLPVPIKIFTPLIICCGGMCLISNWAWAIGLTPINLDRYGYYNHYEENKSKMQEIGISNICNYIKNENEKEITRTILYGSDPAELLYISGIADYWLDISNWGNKEIISSQEELCKYFDTINLDFFVFNKTLFAGDSVFQSRMTELAQDGKISILLEEGDNLLLSYNKSPKEVDSKLLDVLR